MFVDAGKTGFPKPINYPSSYAFPQTALYFTDNADISIQYEKNLILKHPTLESPMMMFL